MDQPRALIKGASHKRERWPTPNWFYCPEHIAQILGQGVRRGVVDLAGLAQYLEPLARRYGQPDGQSLVAHMLDLVGLSPTALARDLAKTSAGLELMAAGRASALTEMFASMPELNDSISADTRRRFDAGEIAGLLSLATRAQSPTTKTEAKA